MKLVFKEIRTLHPEAVQAVCIRNEWYTNGTNKEYEKLLDMCNKENITTATLASMAQNIMNHSVDTGESYVEQVQRIMFILNAASIIVFKKE